MHVRIVVDETLLVKPSEVAFGLLDRTRPDRTCFVFFALSFKDESKLVGYEPDTVGRASVGWTPSVKTEQEAKLLKSLFELARLGCVK